MIIFFKEIWRVGRTGKKSKGPKGRNWPGSYSMLNVAKEHGQIVTSIVQREEQFPGRWWLDQLASVRALLGGQARPRRCSRICSPPCQGG